MKRIKGTMASLVVLFVFLSVNSCAPKWAKTYGGGGPLAEYANSIQQTADNGYIVAGPTDSFGAGSSDFWVLKLDANGTTQWQKTYGGPLAEYANSIQQTADNGYIVAGSTGSFGAGSWDVWVLKLDANGVPPWQKTYGGTSAESAQSIQQTEDTGYIVAGFTGSFGAGSCSDFWVLKLDANGTTQWQKTYGGTNAEHAFSIQQTADNGYIVAGPTDSFGAGHIDFWVLKLDANGVPQWQKTYGGTNQESAYSIQQTTDNGYIVAGHTDSFGAGSSDFWVLKLDAGGDILWQKTYGGTNAEHALSIQQTADNGYIVAGSSYSFTGSGDVWVLKLDAEGNISDTCPPGIGQDTSIVPQNTSVVPADSQATVSNTSCTVTTTSVTPQDSSAIVETQCIDMTWAKTYGGTEWDWGGIQQTSDGGYIVAGCINFPPPPAEGDYGGHCDLGVLKLDATGCIEWQKTYGRFYVPGGDSGILETIDKGYIIAVYEDSFGGDIRVLKLDAGGAIQWQKQYGGSGWDVPYAIQQTADGSYYMVAGFSSSFGAGNEDAWVLKLDTNGTIQWEKTYGGESWDMAGSIQQTSDGGYIVAGHTSSFGAGGGGDIWVLKLDASGTIQWQKSYGGTNYESGGLIQQTADGGYIVTGTITYSEPARYDLWILKLDMYGNIQWQKSYGGTNNGKGAGSIQQTADGGYIVAGQSQSFGAGGDMDGWVVKLDGGGDIQWQKTYGGTGVGGAGVDVLGSIKQIDGGYIVAGETDSFGAGGRDIWVLKMDAKGNISDTCPPGIGQDTSVVPANTSVVPVDTQAIVSDTSCSVTSTSVAPQDINVIVETQCQN